MNPVLAVSIIGLLIQGFNVYLFLKIRVAQLESEKRILDQVHDEYVPRESCALMCPRGNPNAA